MVTLNEINSVDWQIKVGTIGEIVEGLEDIDQCIRTIITTPKGSVAHNPLFGTDIWKYLDSPINSAIPDVVREIIEGIEAWEPRVNLIGITPVTDVSSVTFRIEWQPVDTDEIYFTEVQINGAS